MGTTTANRGSQIDLLMDIWGFIAEKQLKRREPVATNCTGDKTGSIITNFLNNSIWSGNTPYFLRQKKSNSQASTSKVILLLFWDCYGLILEYNLEQGTTFPAASYSEILKSKLKPVNHNKHRGLLSKGVIFLYNNALLQQPLLKPSGSWNLNFSNTPHIVWP
jgi:hypothetical protein